MNADGSTTPLGTLTWKPIRYEDGMAVVGKNFGGEAFKGCPDDGRTRFFRGHYMEGGDLIACTRGEDTKELVGRFNGREDFRSGSFVVKMLTDGFFLGKYDEDGGITTKWCGNLKDRLVLSSSGGAPVDTAAPSLRFRAPAHARPGTKVQLTLAARDNSKTTSVDISVIKGAKALGTDERRRRAPGRDGEAGLLAGAAIRQGSAAGVCCRVRSRGKREQPQVRPAHGGMSDRERFRQLTVERQEELM